MADTWKDMVKDTAKGVEYLRKLKKGGTPQIDRMENAVEGPTIPPAPPENEKKLRKRSTEGSLPFTPSELKQGYRKL